MRRGSAVGGVVAAVSLAAVIAIAARRGGGPLTDGASGNVAAPGMGSGGATKSPPPSLPSTATPPNLPEPVPADGEISVLSLLNEMSRLDHLARLPAVRFWARQQSSSDRRARDPHDAETWFANDDFVTDTKPNLVRVDDVPGGGKRYVLLDQTGPGAIVRMWTATPTGTLRVFIDDDSRPAVEASMAQLLSGQVAPFGGPFGQVTAMGYSLYFPFPFRRHAVVTVDSIVSTDPFSGRPVDKLYYQIGTRAYDAAAAEQVRPYSAAELARAQATVARVARELRDGPPQDDDNDSDGGIDDVAIEIPTTDVQAGHPLTVTIDPPQRRAGDRGADGGAITRLRVFTSERDPGALRSTWLTITFDGDQTVHAPLVDFFGTGPGWNTYASLPMTVGADGWLTCRFPMPFRKRAVLSIGRAGPGTIQISGDVAVQRRPFTRASLIFHARRHDPEAVRTRPFSDWPLATLTGRGHVVGAVLNVDNPPGVAWWGEGDEKIFVDGETFPSLFGTGTEDYFGYAWSSGQLFAHPYHAQTRATGPGFAGQFSMNRWHVVDPIPFQSSLRFEIEAWHWSDTTMKLDGTIYWYAAERATRGGP